MNALAIGVANVLLTVTGAGALAVIGFARSRRDLVRMAGVAWLAGMAVAGIAGAILTPLGAHVSWLLVILPTAGGAAAVWRLTGERIPGTTPPARAASITSRAAAALLAGATASIGIVALWALSGAPLEEYDGWAMWGMKAHALAALGTADPDVFASAAYFPAHLEYPLAIPFLSSLPLVVAGTFDSNVVVIQGFLTGVAGIAGIWFLLRDRVRPVVLWAWLAAIVATPAVAGQLGTGYADVQLALFVAVGLVCLARWAEDGRRPMLALGAVFLAAAALSKNEGALFAAAAILSTLVVAKGRRRSVLVCGAFVLGMLIPWHVWTTTIDIPRGSDYDLGSSFDPGYVLGRLGRIRLTYEWFWRRVLFSGDWKPLPLIAIATVTAGLTVRRSQAAVLAALFSVLSVAGLTWIYLISPLGVDDFLDSNGTRVVASVVLGVAALGPLIVDDLIGRPAPATSSGTLSTRPGQRPQPESS